MIISMSTLNVCTLSNIRAASNTLRFAASPVSILAIGRRQTA
jgi:hypothetical protein